MKQSLQDFKSSAIYRDALDNHLAQSIMLISPDKYALSTYADYLIATLLCEGEHKPCGNCTECNKIKHKNNVDVHYYPKSSKNIDRDEIADLLDTAIQAPYSSDKKIFVLNNANLISVNMQNKLLKTLEEPPKDTYFLLLATEDNNILQTIKSRSRKWHLNKISMEEIRGELEASGLSLGAMQQILNYCDGDCSLALNYAQNPDFADLVTYSQNLLGLFRRSNQMLDFAPKLYKLNDNFNDFLSIFLKNVRDAVALLGGKNTENPLAKILVRDFSPDALVGLVHECSAFLEKRARNCNYNALVDSFLFMILEVRHKWPV